MTVMPWTSLAYFFPTQGLHTKQLSIQILPSMFRSCLFAFAIPVSTSTQAHSTSIHAHTCNSDPILTIQPCRRFCYVVLRHSILIHSYENGEHLQGMAQKRTAY